MVTMAKPRAVEDAPIQRDFSQDASSTDTTTTRRAAAGGVRAA
jgi:hypothetical protein